MKSFYANGLALHFFHQQQMAVLEFRLGWKSNGEAEDKVAIAVPYEVANFLQQKIKETLDAETMRLHEIKDGENEPPREVQETS